MLKMTFDLHFVKLFISCIRFDVKQAGSSRAHGEQRVNWSEDDCAHMCHTLLSLSSAACTTYCSADLEGKEANCQILMKWEKPLCVFSSFILADISNKEKASWNRSRLGRAAFVPTWLLWKRRGQRSLYWNLNCACKNTLLNTGSID